MQFLQDLRQVFSHFALVVLVQEGGIKLRWSSRRRMSVVNGTIRGTVTYVRVGVNIQQIYQSGGKLWMLKIKK